MGNFGVYFVVSQTELLNKNAISGDFPGSDVHSEVTEMNIQDVIKNLVILSADFHVYQVCPIPLGFHHVQLYWKYATNVTHVNTYQMNVTSSDKLMVYYTLIECHIGTRLFLQSVLVNDVT